MARLEDAGFTLFGRPVYVDPDMEPADDIVLASGITVTIPVKIRLAPGFFQMVAELECQRLTTNILTGGDYGEE